MRVPALSNCQKLRSDPPFCEKCSTIDSDRYSLIFALITESERSLCIRQCIYGVPKAEIDICPGKMM